MDGCEGGELRGRLYNPFLSEGARFDGLMAFLLAMESLLDDLQSPRPFMAGRSFRPPPEPVPASPPDPWEPRAGARGTFAVRVMFRQNASWQGSVTWLEGGVNESFRSALELLLLMNSALEGGIREKRKKA